MRGVNIPDQKGKCDLVKWDRIILVAIRPNIKPDEATPKFSQPFKRGKKYNCHPNKESCSKIKESSHSHNMRPNSMIFSFFNKCECGDASHEAEQNVKIKSGDNLSKACGKDEIRESCFERGWDLLSRMAIYVL